MAFNYSKYYKDWRENHAISQADRYRVAYEDSMKVTGQSKNYQTMAYALARVLAFRFKTSPILPYDTGNFMKNGIVTRPKGKNRATVRFGNAHVPYAYSLQFSKVSGAGNPNRHEGFVEKILESGVLDEIRKLAEWQLRRDLVEHLAKAPKQLTGGSKILYLEAGDR